MDEKLRQTIINRIVAEVLHRIGQQAPKDEEVFGTVVLVTSFVPSKKSALDALRRNFMGQMEFIRFGVEFEPIKEKTYDIEESGEPFVLDKVASAADLVLLTPKIGLMERIAMGEDEGFIEHLLTRSLLWGRRVTMLLDFTPPRFKRNTFFEKIATTIAALEDMGVRIVSYRCATQKDIRGLGLVTEQEVLAAHKQNKKELFCMAGALVTPLAKDKAKELGIAIHQ